MAGGPSPLRQCLVQRPPLVACALGLAALGLALAALGAHVQAHNVRDSEAQDWNALLAAVAELRFCPESGPAPPPTAGTAASASVSVQVSLRFDLPGGPRPNATRFAATVSARRLGLAGPAAALPVRLVALSPWGGPGSSCLRLDGPAALLPRHREPPRCVLGPTEAAAGVTQGTGGCLRPRYHPDPALTPTLSPEERALCSQRLVLSGLALLGLCALGLALAAAGIWPTPARDKWAQV
ncbi:uncharacterized protein LOC109285366 isoform X4 [Alligator mississippiensis]|uniref:uncharacterized protein LOC109285366 isoform X4 n=1 Tax=Alligator mississippiensis TaxID=8496 RepID=UPI0009070C0D|nr:uncharacterized protein LOC109285366 isoform X4 [Alligator mississippiensis]